MGMFRRMKPEHLVTLVAIGSITILEVVALMKGIDGQVLSTVFAIIAGLGGYTVGKALHGGERNENSH